MNCPRSQIVSVWSQIGIRKPCIRIWSQTVISYLGKSPTLYLPQFPPGLTLYPLCHLAPPCNMGRRHLSSQESEQRYIWGTGERLELVAIESVGEKGKWGRQMLSISGFCARPVLILNKQSLKENSEKWYLTNWISFDSHHMYLLTLHLLGLFSLSLV